MTQLTSIQAYQEIQGTLGKRQAEVNLAFKIHGDMTNAEVSKMMGLPINVITPRVKELREKGLVEFKFYKRDDITHKKAMVWGMVHTGDLFE